MRVADFSFVLPEALIARYPRSERSSCRLLSLEGSTGVLEHGVFTDLLDKLSAGDLLVFNNTRVIPARLFGQKASGGKLEVLVERILDDKRVLAHIRASKSPNIGTTLWLGDDKDIRAVMVARHNILFELCFEDERDVLTILNAAGHMPLPPYINRPDEAIDSECYQTVYSSRPGAVAAPTAGLHFDQLLLEALRTKGVMMAFVTLHVGAGTFQPVRVDNIKDHVMHSEYMEVSAEVVAAVKACQARGQRVIAVGTTSVRALESAVLANGGEIGEFAGDTRIFIYPGYRFQIVDALVTNFHLPGSTLIMLVSAFAGYQYVLRAYHQAIAEQYRFFSYGDAMFITHNPLVTENVNNALKRTM